MVQVSYVAKPRYEDLYDLVVEKRNNFDARLEEAKQLAIEKVVSEFAEEKEVLDDMFGKVSVAVEIEIPDEVEEEQVSEECGIETANDELANL